MEMEYFSEYFLSPLILEQGNYKGHDYFVVNIGTHPCCYVELPVDHKFYSSRMIGTLSVPCHGGITYTGHLENLGIETSSLFIGWDYAHCTD